MSSLSLTHTSADGTLLKGTSHGDGSARVLRRLGWRWNRQAQCWYIPASRGRHPQQNLISTTIERLEPLGLTTIVNLDADNQAFSSGPTAPQATGNHVQAQPFSKPAEAHLDGGTVAPGLTALSKETISAGDTVKHDGQWLKVLRANERTVTVLLREGGDTVRYSYLGLQGHRSADGS